MVADLDAATVRSLLAEVGAELDAVAVVADLFLVGGAAVALAYDSRRLTRDVDAVFAPAAQVRTAAERVAQVHGLSADWLNDAVKGFLPPGVPASRLLMEVPGLRVEVAEPRYLLALKLRAARDEDVDDVRLLAGLVGITTAQECLALLEAMFPPSMLTARLQFFAEEVFTREEPQ
jgi:predicted nucleotidyltransferase